MDDLTTDRTQEQRRLDSVLTFLDYLDHTKLWPQLRDRIDPMLDTGTITQGDLAARFVSIYSNDEIGEFRVNEFDKLIPRASWRADQFSADTTTTLHDTTLASCAIHAARQVRKILDAQAAQQGNPAPPP